MNTQPAQAVPAKLLVKKSIQVAAPPERAFRVFTQGMDTWWPLGSHHIGKSDAVGVVMEPRAGGRWYERGKDGSECEWGRVLAWDPPTRVVLAWQISADWGHDKDLLTEVEIRFVPDGKGTRVELEHRLLEAYGARAPEMQGIFSSDNGWSGMLAAFAQAAARATS